MDGQTRSLGLIYRMVNVKIRVSILFAIMQTLVVGCASDLKIDSEGMRNQVASAPVKPDQGLPISGKSVAQETEKNIPKKLIAVIDFSGEINKSKASNLLFYIKKMFLQQSVKDFVIYINSNGGNMDSAIAMYQSLKALPISITTVNIGAVESAAVGLYCSGGKRYSMQNSYFMIHGITIQNITISSRNQLEAQIRNYKIFYEAQKDMLKSCSNMNESLIDDYIKSSDPKRLTSHEAREFGIVQNIGSPDHEKSENVDYINILLTD